MTTSAPANYVADFRADLAFDLDDFQVRACDELAAGRGVLVAAPTGAGKTIVGEFAVYLATRVGRKAFYTTPIKALSNQKYRELRTKYGEENVGLLTGDTVINGEAPIVVMTTEVLRNMLYAESETLTSLGYVVMDEVHYLADRFRGAVWEEVIIHLPPSVTVVSLSATVSNAEEFGDWLNTVRDDTAVIVSEQRPVPLWQHLMVDGQLINLFSSSSKDGHHRLSKQAARLAAKRGRGDHRRRGPRLHRSIIIARLLESGLLPAIFFIFSRDGCDAAVSQCVRAGVRLTDGDQVRSIERIVAERVSHLSDDDLRALGYHEWLTGLKRGIAAHHAGLLPTFKEVVEELFAGGLLKVVFATETLALGVNMPAKSVVLERLVKYNGEAHVQLTAAEYTQLTGRAGRRGLDTEGHAVVLDGPNVDPEEVAGLAGSRTYPLRSSFRASYNMAVNLLDHMDLPTARDVLQSSFAQFQADRSVVDVAGSVRKLQQQLDELPQPQCDLGDFDDYESLRRQLTEEERSRSEPVDAVPDKEIQSALRSLRRGEVFALGMRRRPRWAVVIRDARSNRERSQRGRSHRGNSRQPEVITEDGQLITLSAHELTTIPKPIGLLRLPRTVNTRKLAERRDIARTLRQSARAGEFGEVKPTFSHHDQPERDAGRLDRIRELREALRAHPCHPCPERADHIRVGADRSRVQRRIDKLTQRVESSTDSLVRTFDHIAEVLLELGYLHRTDNSLSVTEDGRMLRGIYSEHDLLIADCLRQKIWADLTAAELAAVVSTMVFNGRGEPQASPRMPTSSLNAAWRDTMRVRKGLTVIQQKHHVDISDDIDAGAVEPIWQWASGSTLEQVLFDTGMSPGDFVRLCRQVLDALGQIQAVAPDEQTALTAHSAVKSINRAVIAAATRP